MIFIFFNEWKYNIFKLYLLKSLKSSNLYSTLQEGHFSSLSLTHTLHVTKLGSMQWNPNVIGGFPLSIISKEKVLDFLMITNHPTIHSHLSWTTCKRATSLPPRGLSLKLQIQVHQCIQKNLLLVASMFVANHSCCWVPFGDSTTLPSS